MTSLDAVHLFLLPADSEESSTSPRCQQAITSFYNRVRAGGRAFDATGFGLGTRRSGGGFTGRFVLPLAQLHVPTFSAAVRPWLDERAGRSIILRLRETELHVRTHDDLNRCLTQLLTLPPADEGSELDHA